MFTHNPAIAEKLTVALTVCALHVGLYDLLRVFLP